MIWQPEVSRLAQKVEINKSSQGKQRTNHNIVEKRCHVVIKCLAVERDQTETISLLGRLTGLGSIQKAGSNFDTMLVDVSRRFHRMRCPRVDKSHYREDASLYSVSGAVKGRIERKRRRDRIHRCRGSVGVRIPLGTG